jgi:molybdate transport system substrate-binding protein
MKKLLSVSLIFVLCISLLAGCSKKEEPKPETELYVFIAASLSNAMDEIAQKYKEVNPNVTIIFNADSSGTLKTQIEEGADCDVFFSAAMKQMNELNDAGYIETDSIVKLLGNKVVLIKPKNVETKVTGFDNITLANNLALAGEDVPVGSYAREIFNHLGILDQVMSMEINECANVSAVLAAVSEASNEIGITYATDAYSQLDSVEIIAEAPDEYLETPVLYPIAQVKNDKADDTKKEAAKEFIQFLQSEDAKKIFEKYLFSNYEN